MIELLNNILDSILNNRLAPVLGGLAVIWIGYRLYTSKSTKDRYIQEYNAAASTFRNIFERIKAVIEQNPNLTVSQIIDDILVKSYPDQRIAMENLRRQIKFFKRCAFSKAWQKYVNPENCGDEPFLSYSGMPYEEGKSFDRQYILDTIKHLLTFANK